MRDLLPDKVQQLLKALFSQQGRASLTLRQSAEAYGEASAGINRTPDTIPANLTNYLDKVARTAYKVTDKDIARLQEAGYSEDEIFEITWNVAVGAGIGRMKRGLMAVRGIEAEGNS